MQHVFTTNNVLSEGYDADIVKNPNIPDRDIFVFDTETDREVDVVNTVGTLLYGIAVDSEGNVFVAQTDAAMWKTDVPEPSSTAWRKWRTGRS